MLIQLNKKVFKYKTKVGKQFQFYDSLVSPTNEVRGHMPFRRCSTLALGKRKLRMDSVDGAARIKVLITRVARSEIVSVQE